MSNLSRIIPTVWIRDTLDFCELVEMFATNGIKKLRINCTRHSVEEYKDAINFLNTKTNNKFSILLDMPILKKKVRLFYDWIGHDIVIEAGKKYCIRKMNAPSVTENDLYVEENDFYSLLKNEVGDELVVGEDNITVLVQEKNENNIYVIATSTGSFTYGKYVISEITKYALCKADVVDNYIRLANNIKCEEIALSFVEKAEEVREVRSRLDYNARIISKIETCEGVNNIKEILEVSDGVMIGRGDLLNNMGYGSFAKACDTIAKNSEENHKHYYLATGVFESVNDIILYPSRCEICELYATLKYTNADIILEYSKCRSVKQAESILKIIKEVAI